MPRQPKTGAPRPAAAKSTVYDSPAIIERRQRILLEARSLIVEFGYEGFTIRDLARRAKVAQRTLYNAFGSRENIVASAIHQFARETASETLPPHPAWTLLGQIERTIKSTALCLSNRSYVSALVVVHNSPSAAPAVRQTLRRLSSESAIKFGEYLAAHQQFAAHVSPAHYADNFATLSFAVLSSWCAGEIDDNSLIERMVELQLCLTHASSRGATKKESAEWLTKVRARDKEWVRLCREAATPPERKARRRNVE